LRTPDGSAWNYVGPPGEGRMDSSPSVEGRNLNVATDHDRDSSSEPVARSAGWPYDLLGTEMQSKNVGLKGLASLVEAASGETSG
jgi:hypothetical protein